MRSRLPKRRRSYLRMERMSSYEEMTGARKRARVLFLELKAFGPELLAQQSPEERIKANKPGLLKICLNRWDPDLEAIQREGAV
jgi:hypothetical protein